MAMLLLFVFLSYAIEEVEHFRIGHLGLSKCIVGTLGLAGAKLSDDPYRKEGANAGC